jgi:hypothetical protein
MRDLKRLRGLHALLRDAVDQGTAAVERVHLATAERPFAILERIPPTAPVARVVHVTHDAIASSVYFTIRAANRLVGAAASRALDALEAPPAGDLLPPGESTRPAQLAEPAKAAEPDEP